VSAKIQKDCGAMLHLSSTVNKAQHVSFLPEKQRYLLRSTHRFAKNTFSWPQPTISGKNTQNHEETGKPPHFH
jgi:hypothetical protein